MRIANQAWRACVALESHRDTADKNRRCATVAVPVLASAAAQVASCRRAFDQIDYRVLAGESLHAYALFDRRIDPFAHPAKKSDTHVKTTLNVPSRAPKIGRYISP